MMKKFFTLLATLFCALVAMPAQHNLGYCSGELSTIGNVSVEGKTWVSGAIYLPPSMLAPYEGGKITGLRAGLASKLNVDTLRLWIRSDLNGANLAEETVTKKTEPKLTKGWNEVPLASPYDLNTEEGLYIGYSYHQKGATSAFSVVGSQMDNAFFAQLGADAEWQDLSKSGILSVEAIVDAEMNISHDLALLSAAAYPDSEPGQNRISVTLRNNGGMDIYAYTLSANYENCSEYFEQAFNESLQVGEKRTVEFKIPSIATNEKILVNVVNLGEDRDEIEGNNTVIARFSFMKKVLAEEFTTEACGNCPRVAGYLHEMLGKDEYKDRVIALCHHAGYYTDAYTQPIDEDYVRFFGIGGAPYMMFDRAPLFNNGLTVTICPDMEDMESAFNKRLAEEAHVSVAMTATYDEDAQTLYVNVSGEKTRSLGANERIMIYVVENNVKQSDKGQSGAPDKDWTHQHVIRAYNGSWGEPLITNGNEYEMNFTFDISPEWNNNNMQIIAALGNYDDSSSLNCVVDNCEQINFPSTSAINAVYSDFEAESLEYFNINGTRINGEPSVPGIYIVRETDKEGYVHSRKTIIK